MIIEKVESSKSILPKAVGDLFGVKGKSKKMTMTVSFPKTGDSVNIQYITGEGKVNDLSLSPGDQMNLSHDINLNFLKQVFAEEIAFPLKIIFNEHEYKLNKTKNGKLILTK